MINPFSLPFAAEIATAFAVALLVLAGVQTIRLHQSQAALASAHEVIARSASDLGQCRSNVSTLNEAIDRQNVAVAELARIGAKTRSDADKALVDALRANQRAVERQDAIKAATPGEDRCASADALISEVAG